MSNTRPLTLCDEDLDRLAILPDIMKQCHMFNMAGYGLPVSNYTRLALGMRELVWEWPLKAIRFWGKILGTQKDYFIVETEFETTDDIDGEDDNNETGIGGDINDRASRNSDTISKDVSLHGVDDGNDNDNIGYDDDEVPVAYKPPVVIPAEEPGTGANTKVYFVCNEPGLGWTRLPNVTPAQIVVARQTRHLFTGNLEHVHATFPPFPGNEANYLRAQIARISSSTSISPIGYFRFPEDGEEEEEDNEEARDTYILDEDFDGVSSYNLCDPSLTSWVHHGSYILPQGRTTWFNPVLARPGGRRGDDEEEEDDEDDEEEERNEPDEPEPELPQPLLMPISEDVDVGTTPAWTVRLTSQFVPEHSPVAVCSVTWPGAVTVAMERGKFFENLYIGFGQKQLDSTFDPATPQEPEMEFPMGPEVMEKEDPTPGEEAAIRAALKEQEEWEGGRGRRGDGEEDEEEEEEEGEDGDDADYDVEDD